MSLPRSRRRSLFEIWSKFQADVHMCHFSQFCLLWSIFTLSAFYRFHANYNVMFCGIKYHLRNLKTWKKPNFMKSNTLPWVFFMFLKLYKWYQIAQSITYYSKEILLFCWTLIDSMAYSEPFQTPKVELFGKG